MPELTMSDKKRAKSVDVLQEANEWLRVTLASIGDGVITTDQHGRLTMLNPVAQTLTGWTEKKAVGHPLEKVFRIVNQETRGTVENPALRALREGRIVGLANHTLLIAKDGTERPIDDSAAPIRNSKGEVAGAVLVFRDITERYEHEQLIRSTLDYAVNILETQRDPFLVLDSQLRVVSANRAFYATFQVPKEETEGRLLYDLGSGQWNIPKLRELLERILPQNSHFDDFEVAHDFEIIGERVMLLNARRVRKPGDHSELILLAIEDITESKHAQEAMRDSETRYRRLFEAAKDGILILDVDTAKIIEANPYIADLVGVAPNELIGKELHDIGLFGDIEENKQAFRQLQRDGYIQYDNLPLRNARGETVEVEFVSNVYPQDGHSVAQCNIRSIAERRLREQTRILADENRRKDEFLAMLSHELRNPLAPIRSAVYLLRTRERPGEDPLQKQAHEVIERQVANMTRLLSDLLEVSRATSGRIRIELQTLDLREVIQHALESVRALVELRKHKLVVLLPHEPVWVNIDPTRMEEVVVNLVSNAAKYTDDDGNGQLRIVLETSPDRVAILHVKDNGEGMDQDLIERVFDLFSQGKRSLDRSQGGLGIGLALARRLLELMGGSIEATSNGLNRGSEFIVRLAVADPPPLPETSEEQRERAGLRSEAVGTVEGQRVLVVDDNIDQTMMVAAWLRLQGYSVQSAYTGPDGLRIAQQWLPDVILLDIGLPGMDGYEVARRIRAAPELDLKKVRIIAVTGYGRDVEVDRSREAGFDGHLIKPVDFKDLEKMVRAPDLRSPQG